MFEASKKAIGTSYYTAARGVACLLAGSRGCVMPKD